MFAHIYFMVVSRLSSVRSGRARSTVQMSRAFEVVIRLEIHKLSLSENVPLVINLQRHDDSTGLQVLLS